VKSSSEGGSEEAAAGQGLGKEDRGQKLREEVAENESDKHFNNILIYTSF
jgi:hypothetical protein